MRFEIANTHAYPGCRVRLADEDNADEIVAQFSDGTIAGARYSRDGSATIRLTISPYRTARGTDIAEKSWILTPDPKGGGWKIKARSAD
ncbi:MAG: hypothetical protein QM684_13225 [Rhizobium sp.]